METNTVCQQGLPAVSKMRKTLKLMAKPSPIATKAVEYFVELHFPKEQDVRTSPTAACAPEARLLQSRLHHAPSHLGRRCLC